MSRPGRDELEERSAHSTPTTSLTDQPLIKDGRVDQTALHKLLEEVGPALERARSQLALEMEMDPRDVPSNAVIERLHDPEFAFTMPPLLDACTPRWREVESLQLPSGDSIELLPRHDGRWAGAVAILAPTGVGGRKIRLWFSCHGDRLIFPIRDCVTRYAWQSSHLSREAALRCVRQAAVECRELIENGQEWQVAIKQKPPHDRQAREVENRSRRNGDWVLLRHLLDDRWEARAYITVRTKRGPHQKGIPCHSRLKDSSRAGAHRSREAALCCAERTLITLHREADTEKGADVFDRSRRRRDEFRRSLRVGPGWAAMRRRVLAEEPTCRSCGAPATDVDHIIPLANGGTSDRSNLQALCGPCHWSKTNGRRQLRPDPPVIT